MKKFSTNHVFAHKCNKCDFICSRADKLRTHFKTHSGEKPNKCKQCKYASSRTDMLRIHLKMHDGEKLNKCNQCDFASSQADHLSTHLKTHCGEKLNKCNQCNFASFQAGHLRRHMRMHSGEKSNKCNQCDFASSRACNLRTHMLYQNPEKYRYFIFKNPGIGIWVQSRYTGIFRYTARAWWGVAGGLQHLLVCQEWGARMHLQALPSTIVQWWSAQWSKYHLALLRDL